MIRLSFSAVVLALLSSSYPSLAQSFIVTGNATDTEDAQPLVGASVILYQSENVVTGTATDVDGSYRLQVDEPGIYELIARFVGYSDQRFVIEFASDTMQIFDFQMTPGVSFDPVVVTGSRHEERVLKAPASMSVVPGRRFMRDPAFSEEATLRLTNGVDYAQLGLDRYQLSLRGFNTIFVAHTQLRLDHRPATLPNLGANVIGLLPVATSDIASTEVVLGPASALFGSGAGQGVIHVRTKDAFSYPGTTVSFGAGERSVLEGSFRHASIINNRLAFKLVGSFKRGSDWEYDPDDPDDAIILDPLVVPFDYDIKKGLASAQIQFRPASDVTLSASAEVNTAYQTGLGSTGLYQTIDYRIYGSTLRAETSRLFSQIYFSQFDSGDTFDPYSGEPFPDDSRYLYAQARYTLDLPGNPRALTFGADGDLLFAKNAFTGTSGENDDLFKYGAYANGRIGLTSVLDLVASGRIDADNVTNGVHFSPRLGLILEPTPNQTFRAVYNEAFALPIQGELFLDILIPTGGPFTFRALGIKDPWTFSEDPATSSFATFPDFPYADEGIGIDISRAYAVATSALIGEGGAFPSDPALAELLLDRIPAVSGFSSGFAAYEGEDGLVVLDSLGNIPGVKANTTRSFEVGYKGLFDDRILVGVDLYYVRRKNGISELQTITPSVFAPEIATDVAAAVRETFSDAELAQFGLSVEELASNYAEAASSLSEEAIGIVEPEENFDPSTLPEVILTYINFGQLEYFGADFEVQVGLGQGTQLFANAGWLSDNFFDESELDEIGTGFVVAMNTPKYKIKAGGQHTFANGLSLGAAGRYVDEFEVRSGVHSGTVPSYFLLDLNLGIDFGQYVAGARLDITASNILDNEHREFASTPMLGRMVMGRLSYTIR